ncbi:protocadherin alpha-7-like isoform X2 [Erpetoichthys calabaricus]|uniref:protocadherin alpha-7-like isoform X2 n=1 Tax=Erpetoichthys calabaricus TaxID=27687 RepID=UPI002234A9C7|nr:protocadherin alpha-7-like isoform X2 [Erpetoichthys calabaricus]
MTTCIGKLFFFFINMLTMRGLRCFKQTVILSALVSCFWKYSFAYLRYSVPEESASGTIIGNIIKDLGLDIKNIEGRGFRVISGLKEQLLQVNHKTGVLFVNEIIDREMLCDRDKPCFLNVKIIIENPLEIHQAEIEITDINDNSPAFSGKNKSLEISESTPIGSRFTLEGAVDPDFGVNSLKSYQLSQNDHFILQVKEGSKRNKIPVLVLQKPLDRELKAKYNLLLTAFDGGNPPRSANMNITVMVGDINDNAPVFAEEMYSVTLEENVLLGTLVVQVNASDLDEGSNGEIFYSFDESVQNIVNELFELDAYTGEIRVKGVIDFEEKQFYEIEIKATDRGHILLSSQCTALIKIKDMNDNAPVIEITSLTSSITEDVKPGTVVGLISIRDFDSGVNSKIACTCSDNLPFELKQSFRENLYSLVTKSRLDRESVPQYNITITAKDFGNPSLSSHKTAVVNVLDVNDNSPRFLQNPYVFYILENNTPGASILSVSAVDEDTNENALITYYMRENEAVEKSVVPFLSINSNNGQVFSFTSFDFEELKSFTFMVVAKDSGTPSLSSNVTVNVFILDENDNPPVVVFPLTLNGTAVVQETIPRNVKAGYLITRIRAYDADVGYNAWLSFSLEEATDSSLFSVGRHTGDVRTRRTITESDVTVQKITILVKDSGSISFSASATVIVTAAENTEAHALSEVKRSTTEEEQDNQMTFYLIILLSSVSFLFIFTIIALIAFQCHRAHRNLLGTNYLGDVNYAEVSDSLFHSHQYQTAEKRFVFVEPGMNKDSVVDLGSNANTLVFSDGGVKIAQMTGDKQLVFIGPGMNRDSMVEVGSNTNTLLVSDSGIKIAQVTGDKQLVFIGPGMNRDSMVEVGSNTNTLLVSDSGIKIAQVPKQPNTDWRYSASLRAGMQSSVHMEESAVLQGPSGVHIQNWPTVSSATPEPEAGEVSPPVGAGINSNSWTFKYGPPAGNPQQLKPGEVPENFIIPGSPAIISIRQGPPGAADDKSDFITFGKKEETKKKKKKKKGKADKKEKSNDGGDH